MLPVHIIPPLWGVQRNHTLERSNDLDHLNLSRSRSSRSKSSRSCICRNGLSSARAVSYRPRPAPNTSARKSRLEKKTKTLEQKKRAVPPGRNIYTKDILAPSIYTPTALTFLPPPSQNGVIYVMLRTEPGPDLQQTPHD